MLMIIHPSPPSFSVRCSTQDCLTGKPVRLSRNLTVRKERDLGGVQVVTEMMMGKRVDLALNVSAYSRSFQGEQSPVDLDTCFQLLYRLFTNEVKPTDSNLKTCLK